MIIVSGSQPVLSGQGPNEVAQVETLRRVLADELVSDYSVAIDGGAHVGTWTAVLAERFSKVIAFEPTDETFAYLTENLASLPHVDLRHEALMDVNGSVEVCRTRPNRTVLTARFCMKSETGTVKSVAIDGLGLERCGLIKLDLEGAEFMALIGARQTISRCRPVLVVEIGGLSERYGHSPEVVDELVLQMGYREVFRAGVDRVYAPC